MNLEINKYSAEFMGKALLDRIVTSKVRWSKILRREDVNDSTCVLSTSIYSKEHKYPSYPFPSSRCRMCIIKEVTNKCDCQETPFAEWKQHQSLIHNNSGKVECPECTRIAKEVATFLVTVEETFWMSLLGN